MKALVLNAQWDPRPEYPVTQKEIDDQKAIIASKVWRHPKLTWQDVPEPVLDDDGVIIKLRACGVCGSDTHCFQTDDDGYIIFSGPTRLPVTLGHEYTGEVVEVGKRVANLQVGDLVACEGMLNCGQCRTCRIGHPNQCPTLEMVGFSAPGAYAEYIYSHARHCWKLNDLADKLGDAQRACRIGALIEPTGCAYNGMFITSCGFQPGGHLVIHGAGPIGLAAVQLGKACGAATITIFNRSPVRRELGLAMGADHALNPNEVDTVEAVMDITKGAGADMQVEAAGATKYIMPAIEACFAPVGKMIYLGRTGERAPVQLDRLVTGANMIVGARGHDGYGIFPNIIRLLANNRIDLEPMITSRFPFAQTYEAIERSTRPLDGKIMIEY